MVNDETSGKTLHAVQEGYSIPISAGAMAFVADRGDKK